MRNAQGPQEGSTYVCGVLCFRMLHQAFQQLQYSVHWPYLLRYRNVVAVFGLRVMVGGRTLLGATPAHKDLFSPLLLTMCPRVVPKRMHNIIICYLVAGATLQLSALFEKRLAVSLWQSACWGVYQLCTTLPAMKSEMH